MSFLTATHTWRQTAKSLIVEVPLKGASAKQLDIVATELLVKVSFDRYLLHLDLLEAIDDQACVAKIKQGILSLKLKKRVAGETWASLEIDKANLSKAELQQRRSAALESKAEREAELDTKAKDRKVEDERKALRKLMALEEDERQHIDDLKAEEKKTAEEAVYQRLAEIEQQKGTPGKRQAGKPSKAQQKAQQKVQQKAAEAPTPPPPSSSSSSSSSGGAGAGGDIDDCDADLMREMLDDDDDVAEPVVEDVEGDVRGIAKAEKSAAAGAPKLNNPERKKELNVDELLRQMEEEEAREEEERWRAARAKEDANALDEDYEMVEYPEHEGDLEDDDAPLPDPRAGGVLKMKFTPRIFPTPMRESKQCEEEDWIAKNRSHLRKNPQLRPQLDALDIEDSDPTWLKGKGDDFYRSRDYRAAINAYTTALEVAPELLPVLGNRSACYLQLGELVRCVEDCDALLQQLDEQSMEVNANPNDPAKLAMRLKALARRGTARCQQGAYAEAVGDYRLAVTLTNLGDPSLVADLRRVMGLAKCSDLKKKADGEFGAGQLETALATYGEALEVEKGFVSAISNRAACLLALGRLEECVADCTAALDLMAVDPSLAQKMDQTMIESGGTGINGTAGVQPALPSGPVPPVGSAKRRTWVLKTVARRGTANASLGRTGDAVKDYELACGLDPSDATLKADLESLRSRLETEAANPDTAATTTPSAATTTTTTTAAAPPPPPPPSTARDSEPSEPPPPPPQEEQGQGKEQSKEKVAADPWAAVESGKQSLVALSGKLATKTATVTAGKGSKAVAVGSRVTVQAQGRCKQTEGRGDTDADGAAWVPFWNTRDPGQLPFTYKAGTGGVIKGWDQGGLGMKIGEVRILEIPPAEGYGKAGFPEWNIPPNATLRFTLECLRID